MPYKDKSKYKSEAYREYMRNYQRNWHQRNRARRIAKVYERKSGYGFYNQLKATLECAQCGEKTILQPCNFTIAILRKRTLIFLKRFEKDIASSDQKEVAKCTVLCANCHAKEHYEWARRNKEPSREGLAGQFLEVEQELAVSQEEEFAHAVENQYLPQQVDIYEESTDGL